MRPSLAVLLSILCRNRLSRMRSRDGSYTITPFGWLTGQKLSIAQVHIFGSHCTYFHDSGNKLLPARGRCARFIGLEDDHTYLRTTTAAGPPAVDGGGDACSEDCIIGVEPGSADDRVDSFHDEGVRGWWRRTSLISFGRRMPVPP